MKRLLTCLIFALLASTLYADDLSLLKKYSQEADSAFKYGKTELCFKINEDILFLFNSNRKKNVKNTEICTIVFGAYSSLAILDKRKSENEVCSLLSDGLKLVEDNPAWLKDYSQKNHIIQCYINLIGGYVKLGNLSSASDYNQRMISFAENYYRFEIADVLFSACSMNSLMNDFEKSYPLYKRLYEMFDNLDRLQQYMVVRELIHFEFTKKNYSELVRLSLKHEKLISKSKDEIEETILYLIGSGFNLNANNIAKENEGVFSVDTDNAFKSGCDWALRNYPLVYPMNCIDYAYWLYGFDDHKIKALEQFENYLNCLENSQFDVLFDERYRNIIDAENAIISIIIQKIVKSDKPTDLNSILNKYPKVIASISNAPQSELFEDFNNVISYAKEICYGNK